MKVHKRIIEGQEVKAYNDSNCDWVVILGDRRERFPQKSFSMKHAMEFMVELFGKQEK